MTIVSGSAAIGRTLGELDLEALRVEVTAVRRRNIRSIAPEASMRVEEGDVLVLLGAAEDLAVAEIRLLQG